MQVKQILPRRNILCHSFNAHFGIDGPCTLKCIFVSQRLREIHATSCGEICTVKYIYQDEEWGNHDHCRRCRCRRRRRCSRIHFTTQFAVEWLRSLPRSLPRSLALSPPPAPRSLAFILGASDRLSQKPIFIRVKKKE